MGLVPATSPCNESQGLVTSCVPTLNVHSSHILKCSIPLFDWHYFFCIVVERKVNTLRSEQSVLIMNTMELKIERCDSTDHDDGVNAF